MRGLHFAKIVQVVAIGVGMTMVAACTSADTETKLMSLEEKINTALQNAATAKIDASTALHMAVDLEKKVK